MIVRVSELVIWVFVSIANQKASSKMGLQKTENNSIILMIAKVSSSIIICIMLIVKTQTT
ncbi:MAG: hypothetical protein H7141_00035 [Burkholderiales bacterium]|nr:hypothetical protein [Bacteroidia bacterium]